MKHVLLTALFWKSFFMGLAIAAPIGPVCLLCIRQTLKYGAIIGAVVGLAAATADLFYATLAGLGVGILSEFLMSISTYLKIGGSLFLVYLGSTFLFAKKTPHMPDETPAISKRTTFVTSFLLTVSNPMTMLAFFGIVSSFGIQPPDGFFLSKNDLMVLLMLGTGTFCGAILWYLFLTCGIGLTRKKLSTNHVHRISQGSGLMIIGFALYVLLKEILAYFA